MKTLNHPEARILIPMILAKHGVVGMVTGIMNHKGGHDTWVVQFYNEFTKYLDASYELRDRFGIDITCGWTNDPLPSRM